MIAKSVAYHIVRDLAGENPQNMKPLITTVSSACYYYTLAQDVNRWPFASQARFRSQASLCGICGGQNGTGTCYCPSTWVFVFFQLHSTKPIHLPPTL
jgi:hypothetical protein